MLPDFLTTLYVVIAANNLPSKVLEDIESIGRLCFICEELHDEVEILRDLKHLIQDLQSKV